MDAWEYNDVDADQAAGGRLYHEFLRVPDLSAGLYVLEAGATDPQSPHTEDELYYVVAGPCARSRSAARRGRSCRARWSSSPRPSRTAFHDIDGAARAARRCSAPPRATAPERPATPAERRATASRNASASSGATPDLVVAEEHVHVVARGQERLEPRGPGRELRVRRSRAGAGAGRGTARSAGGSAAPRPRAARSRTARHPTAASAANVSSTCHDGSWNSIVRGRSAGHAASSAGELRIVAPDVRRGRGRGPSRAAPRTPGTDRSATATLAARVDLRARGTSRRAGP